MAYVSCCTAAQCFKLGQNKLKNFLKTLKLFKLGQRVVDPSLKTALRTEATAETIDAHQSIDRQLNRLNMHYNCNLTSISSPFGK